MESRRSHLIPRHPHRRSFQAGSERLGFTSHQDDRGNEEDQEGSVNVCSRKDSRQCNINKSIVGRARGR